MVSLVIGWGMEESVFTGADQKVSFCFPKLLSEQRHQKRRPAALTFLPAMKRAGFSIQGYTAKNRRREAVFLLFSPSSSWS